MRKKITILFPDAGNKPVGGHKIILQYANELARDGYQVHIVYSCYYDLPIQNWHRILRFIKLAYRYIYTRLSNGFSCKRWFNLEPSIRTYYIWSLYSSKIPESDYYIATAAVTANSLDRFNIPINNKLYFIQGYESWQIGEDGLFDTYKSDSTKIVVSNWLKRIVDRYSKTPSLVIPNGFNQSEFRIIKPIEDRLPYSVSILYHSFAAKGFSTGLEALRKVRQKIPELKVFAFGVYDEPTGLPDWFEYYKSPDQKLHNWINNEAAIYLGTSSMEGFGLTIGEAMMCGQAVVCTNNDGYLEMAKPDKNALVCEIGDSEALADAVIRLITDDKLRISLAKNGNQTIQEYTIENSFTKLKSLLD